MPKIYIASTSCGDHKEARTIARQAIKHGLAACVHIFPIESVYMWKGRLRQEKEVAVFMKTTRDRLVKLETMIRKCHSYELPEFSAWPVERVGVKYAAWLINSL